MNITHEIRKFYTILCPGDRHVLARERRGPNSAIWSEEAVWELQEVSQDWNPIGAPAYMFRASETPNGWSVECEGSINIENEAILYASRVLAEELGWESRE